MTKQQIDDETMYQAWVATGRNGNIAAKRLGIHPGTFRHHVRTKNFEDRYAKEQESTGQSQFRLATFGAMAKIGQLYEAMYDIALGNVDGATIKERIHAAETIFRSLPNIRIDPPAQPSTPMLPSLTLVDARQIHSSPVPAGLATPTVAELPPPTEDPEDVSHYDLLHDATVDIAYDHNDSGNDHNDSADDADLESQLRTILQSRQT